MKVKRFVRGDLILIIGLLIAGLILSAALLRTRQDGRQAIVRVNGEIIATLPLTRDTHYPIEADGTTTNILTIQSGAARMTEANCPDRLCIRRGAVRHAGDSIICLPNKVVVEISGADALDLDAVTG